MAVTIDQLVMATLAAEAWITWCVVCCVWGVSDLYLYLDWL